MSQLDYLLDAVQNTDIKAAQCAILHGEGTTAPDGYLYLFGSRPTNTRRFTDTSKHPNIREPFGNNNFSTAAGKYQILYETDQELSSQLVGMGMDHATAYSFTEPIQDLKCVLMFSNKDCCELIKTGHFLECIPKLATIWASLPYSKYGQPTETMTDEKKFYEQAGGTEA